MCCFQNELYCLRCHDKMGIPICGACRRPIEERVVTALGKHWHVEVSVKLISSCLCPCMHSPVLLFALMLYTLYHSVLTGWDASYGEQVFAFILYVRLQKCNVSVSFKKN